jgi:PAS domain S-box-containing protein
LAKIKARFPNPNPIMSQPVNSLQIEFYELLQNDVSISKWLSENIIDGIWYCDLEQPENLWISGSFWKNLDYTVKEEESAFKSTQEDRNLAINLFSKCAADPEKSFEAVYKFRNKAQELVLLQGTGKVIKNSEGKISRLLILHTDLSRNKNMNQQLLEENKELNKANEIFLEAGELASIGGWQIDLTNQKLIWSKITRDIHEVDGDYSPALDTAINFYKEGESRDRINYLFNAAVEKGIPFNEELQLVTAKGNEIWVSAFGKPEFINGICVKIAGAFQDIDQRKKSELELKYSKDKFQQIFSKSSIGIILVGPNSKMLNLNPAALAIFKYEETDLEEALNLNFRDVTHPDDLETIKSYRERLISGEIDNYKLESRFVLKSGEIIWCNVSTSIVSEPDEVGYLIITQVEDITSRKELENQVRENADFFKNSFEYSPNAMAMVTLKGRLLKVNRNLAQTIGYSQEELLDRNFQEVTHPEDSETDLEFLNELVEHKRETYQIEKRYIHKNGSVIYGLLNVSLLRDSAGQPLYFVAQINDVTKNRAAKEALKQSLGELQSIMDATTQVIIIETDLNGIVQKFNKGAENLLGYTSNEFKQNMNIQLLHDKEEILQRENLLKKRYSREISESDVFVLRAKQGKIDTREWTYVRKDGTRFPVQLSVTSIKNEEGEITGFLGVASDISNLKKIEIELRESRQQWQFALEGSGDGVWDWNIPEGKQYMSDQAKNMLGFDAKEALTDIKEWDERIHPEERKKSDQALMDYFEGKAPGYKIEKRIKCKDGHYKWILDRGKIVEWDDQGKPLRMIGTQSDITDRKNAEHLIKENEIRFRSLYELSPIGIGLIDVESLKFISANNALLESTGYDLDELTHLSCGELTSASFNEIQNEQIEGFHKSGIFKPYENEFIRKDGITFPVLINAVKIKDASGKDVLLSTIQNISRRKEMENSLVNAKLKAEAANKSKSEFLANMSHEIRTPLNGVIGFTDLLMKTELSKSQEQYMQTVYYSANTLLDLINDILDFSKIEAGKLELSYEKTDLIELCGQTIDIIKHQAHKKGLEILLNISSEINRYIYRDSIRIRQIITNLLGNAVKFTEKGEVELKIEAIPCDTNSDEMLYTFSIRDTGIGIANNNLQKVFNAFDQEDSSTTRKYGGTGLGLTISNKLLGLMESKLEVISELGLGSIFSFAIRFKSEEGENYIEEITKEITRVLVVDDNKNNRIILREMLAIGNIKSELVSNGIEALQSLEGANRFDLAIVDYNMPYMNGIDLIGHIRNKLNYTREDLPIILLHSSADDEKIYQACKDLNVQFNITKPIKIDQLFKMLKNMKVSVKEKSPTDVSQELIKSETVFTILVAEDNPVNKFLAKTIIRKALPNANILEVENGYEAVEMYKIVPIDLILMDIQMPILSGFEATQKIRALESKDRHVPIIALTARTLKGEQERCAEFGMDDYITKPVIFNTIRDVIQTYLIEPQINEGNYLQS